MGKEIHLMLLILLFTLIPLGCLGGDEGEDDWGADGTLVVNISVNRKTMDIDGSIMVTFKLINNGTTRLRVIPPENMSYDALVEVLDEDYETVPSIMGSDDSVVELTDEDLIVMEPGDELPMAVVFSSDYYEIESGNQYFIRGRYITHGGDFTLTRWEGEIYSSTVKVTVA